LVNVTAVVVLVTVGSGAVPLVQVVVGLAGAAGKVLIVAMVRFAGTVSVKSTSVKGIALLFLIVIVTKLTPFTGMAVGE
jgi:hypothetical protein